MAPFFYITTTLPYVNADPHIGFALEIIQADAIARYHRQQGSTVVFNTGTDEHGVKIFRKAQELNQDPQAYCDEYAAKFDALKASLNLSYTNFIRTTEPAHVAAAQKFWKRCLAKGDIYKKAYQVKYCVGCELEKTESELENGLCPIHPSTPLEMIDEENYFFRFSKYQNALLKLYREVPDFVLPAHRLTEIQKFTETGLEDFSISRLKSKMPWGVPVPDDVDHVMYVWFDALINYISTLGWPDDMENFERYWPGVQIAGKDNLRQQSNMWQAMLMSAELPPSRQILIHGFITSWGQKMSKSLGNVTDPFALVERYGVDAVRFYLLKEIPTSEDGDFNEERFRALYDADLANNLGNLLSRVVAMTEKYFEGRMPVMSKSVQPLAGSLTREGDYLTPVWQAVDRGFREFNLKFSLEAVWALLGEANAFIDGNKPWALAKQGETELLGDVLAIALETLRQVSLMLEPFLPGTAGALRDQLGVTDSSASNRTWCVEGGLTVTKGNSLFPRLEEVKVA